MKTDLTAAMCGCAASLRTEMSSSLKLRNWSTLLRVPRMARSFLSSMVTVWSVKVLKAEKISCQGAPPARRAYGQLNTLDTVVSHAP